MKFLESQIAILDTKIREHVKVYEQAMRVQGSASRGLPAKGMCGCAAVSVKPRGQPHTPRTLTWRRDSVALLLARAKSVRLLLWRIRLVMIYHMLKTNQPYRELGADYLDRLNADYLKRALLKRLERLGLHVTVQSIDRPLALPG